MNSAEKKKIVKKGMLLYAITDRFWTGRQTLEEQVADALEGGITFLQIREKDLDYESFLQEAARIKKLAVRYQVPLIINDNVEAAIAADADGVHVGQSDMEAGKVRERLGEDKIVGVSVSNVKQALRAEENGADYLGVGAVFSTSTKEDADVVSMETLSRICRTVSIPVVAIGGISESNIMKLKGSGVSGVSIISGIFAQPDIRLACIRLRRLSEKMIKEIKGAVFDADGTLLDTMELWEHVGEEYLRSKGIVPEADLSEKTETMTMEESAAYFCREYGLGESKEEIIQEINQMMLTAYQETVLIKPGVREVLCDLKSRNIPMYIATSTDRPLIKAALKSNGIMEYFQGIITCTEAGASKREPKIYHMARAKLGTKTEETFVFEDACFAAKTASEAGYPVVVIRDETAARDQEQLKSLAHIYLESWDDWGRVK